MAANCCIVGCPTVVSGSNVNRLTAFPKKNTAEYLHWVAACKGSDSHINRLRNPVICPLHFSYGSILNRKDIPSQWLATKDLKVLNQGLTLINQLVADWMSLIQQNDPDMFINGNLLKAKAKEVAGILKIHHFDVELGWLHNYEMYLRQSGIKHWRKSVYNRIKTVNKKARINVRGDIVLKLLEDEQTTMGLDSEHSIHTYAEALEKAKLLEEYFKRTENNDALELVAHVEEILRNCLE